MGTVTITGVSPDPEIYGANLAAAVTYISARFGSTYAAWLALPAAPPDDRGRTLVSATDYIDRLALVDTSGAAITHATAIAAVQQACFELAVLINDDPDVVAALDQSFNIKSVDAGGGVGVEFQVPTSVADGSATRLPYVIEQLLAPYLPVSSASVAGGYGGGGSCKSAFSECREYDRKDPY